MSCIKVGPCKRDTPCTTDPICVYYIDNTNDIVKELRKQMELYPIRHTCHTVAEADAYWEKLDWWYGKLLVIISALEELQHEP